MPIEPAGRGTAVRGAGPGTGDHVESDVQALWERYAASHDAATREQLILHYAPLVKYVAGRVGVGMPANVEHADLVSYGIFGLMDAIEKFDVTKGFKFETYAITRIRGAIIDELRSVDWVPRSVRSRPASSRRRSSASSPSCTAVRPRRSSPPNSAGRRGAPGALAKVSMTSMAALDEVLDVGEGDRISLVDTLQDLHTVLPEDSFDDHRDQAAAPQAMTRLTEREQTVLGLYYFEGMTLAQIGDVLGVTESRICQIHTKAVLSLRAKLVEKIRG
jgi:RNA polymerase sigma factor FliA